MNTENSYIRQGIGTVRPYLYGHMDLLDFVKQVFGAEELERNESRKGFHVEVKIGDSVVVLEVGGPYQDATYASVYVYLPDVDAAYQRALQLGATSLDEPSDKPYQDRGAGFKDTFGNTWWIGTYIGGK